MTNIRSVWADVTEPVSARPPRGQPASPVVLQDSPVRGAVLQFQILIDGTMVQIDSNGMSDDALLAFMDQKAVDALAAALAK